MRGNVSARAGIFFFSLLNIKSFCAPESLQFFRYYTQRVLVVFS